MFSEINPSLIFILIGFLIYFHAPNISESRAVDARHSFLGLICLIRGKIKLERTDFSSWILHCPLALHVSQLHVDLQSPVSEVCQEEEACRLSTCRPLLKTTR